LRWSVLVFGADVAKGVIPVVIMRVAFDSPTAEVIAALATVIGHIYPLYANFRGGRAAATGFGALLIMSPPGAALAIGVAIVVLGVTRIMSLSVLLGMSVGGFLHGMSIAHTNDADAYLGFSVGAWLIIVVAHRDNIARLLAGTERILGRPDPNAAPPDGEQPVSGAQPAGD
jgi:glycerol-3-phosphate acyltransferase PlsY